MLDLLPTEFVAQMRTQLREEFNAFQAALLEPTVVSIRLNFKKNFLLKGNSDGVKWFFGGYYLPERPVFTLDPAWHAGAYYVQEASSMFVGEAIRQILGDSQPLKVLDLCAAPGGKSTLLASVLHPESFILCNEVIKSRYHILRENLTKWGYSNTATASHDSHYFTLLKGFFDLVLVDAPCSGEGLFRKDPRAIAEWSVAYVQHCAARQKRILADAVQAVKPGGMLIYCTCTYNNIENEQNANWLAQSFDLEPIPLQIADDWGIVTKTFGYQFYPHCVRGEGFYITCFRKTDGTEFKLTRNITASKWKMIKPENAITRWLHNPENFDFYGDKEGRITAILKSQNIDIQSINHQHLKISFGLELGVWKGKDFVPSHTLALSAEISRDLPFVDLEENQALRFLKKSDLQLEKIPIGWTLVRFAGNNLGWIKGVGNRINNYLPKDWRIIMELPTDN